MTRSEIIHILQERGFRPLKQLGQNFLFDPHIIRFIADALPAPTDDPVLEIGPGLGALTRPLLDRPLRVTALELDRGLAAYLRETLGPRPGFTLIEGDALLTLPLVSPFRWVAGNLPYNISTPLLATLMEIDPLPETCVFTLQREVGERLAAPPRTKDYGAITVYLQTFYRVELLKYLKGTVFYPEPQVGSVVVRLTRQHESPSYPAATRKDYYNTVRRGFQQRRKMLRTLLPVDSDRRAEELHVGDWIQLYETLRGHL